MISNNKHIVKFWPWLISIIYLLLGGLWIGFSEQLLYLINISQETTWFNEEMDSVFILMGSSLFILFLLKKQANRLESRDQTIKNLVEYYKHDINTGYFFRKLFDNLKEAVFVIEPESRLIVDCNAYAGTIFGYSRQELIGKSTHLLHVDEHHYYEFGRISEKALKESGIFHTEYKMKSKNGEILNTDHTVSWVYNSNGEIERVVSIVRDLTHHKENVKAVKQAHKERQDILESITDGFFMVDENWTVTYWNKAAEQILNLPKEQIVGKNLWEIFYSATDLKLYNEYLEAMNTGQSKKFQDYYPALDKWFDISAYPANKALSVFFKDVTINKKQELKIRQAKINEDAMINSTKDLIWSVNVNLQLISANKPFLNFLTEINKQPLSNDHQITLPQVEPERKKKWIEYYSRALAGEQFSVTEETNQNGGVIYCLISFNPILDNELNCTGVACFLRDISDRIQHIKAIETQNERLREIAWTQSHTFRGPLSRLMGLINLLKTQSATGDANNDEIVEYISEAADELDEITRNIVNKSEAIAFPNQGR